MCNKSGRKGQVFCKKEEKRIDSGLRYINTQNFSKTDDSKSPCAAVSSVNSLTASVTPVIKSGHHRYLHKQTRTGATYAAEM
jgi:hypothetical protein